MFADYLYCKLVFQPLGIFLTTEKLSAADFFSRLSAGLALSKTSASVLASTGLVVSKQTMINPEVLAEERPSIKGEKSRSTPVSKDDATLREKLTPFFNRFSPENRILVRHGRITYMAFEAVAQNFGWVFVDPAFRLKDGAPDEDRANFTNIDICCDNRVVCVTYTPEADSGGEQDNYELRLQVGVWTPNDINKPSSYVTIIVDPIIGNEEV